MSDILGSTSVKKSIWVLAIACVASFLITVSHLYLSIQFGQLSSVLTLFVVILISLTCILLIAEQQHRLSFNVAHNILRNITDFVVIKDEKGRFVYGNKSVTKLYGTTESGLVGKLDYDFTGNLEQSEAILNNTKSVLKNFKTVETFDVSTDTKENKTHHFHSIKIPFYNTKNQLRLFIISKDVTDIIQLKEESEKNKSRLQHVLGVSEEGLWEWNPQTGEVTYNESWEEMSGLYGDNQTFEEYENCILEEDKSIVLDAITALLTDNISFNIEYRLKRHDGKVVWIWDRGRIAERDKDNNPTLVVGLALDITQEKLNQQRIQELAYHDQLTGLYNRTQFELHLRDTVKQSHQQNMYSALLFLDIDKFKLLNDSYGHYMGDKLLKIIAEKLLRHRRGNELISRFGGDEFVVILPLIEKHLSAATNYTTEYANQLIKVLSEAVALKSDLQDIDIEYEVTASMGGIIFNSSELHENKVLQLADMALYRAKANGGNEAIILDPQTQNDFNHSGELQKAMRQSIDDSEFCIYLQPKFSNEQKIIGAEALVRWQHPTLGLLAPYHFITMAEESNLIIPIGMQVLEQACEQLQKWQASPTTKSLSIAVNLSAKQIWQKDFAEKIIEVVNTHQIDPSKLIVEVTESIFLKDIKAATKKLNKLKSIGISVSLDDFGTGFSSLSYLRDLPIDEIKIDRSFMFDIHNDKKALMMVKSIISLADNFNLKVVSEGVEEKQQLDLLTQLGLSIFQGFYFSKPIPPKDLDILINKVNHQ
ncbi:EAL domain-containing protein [Psychromonas arctica]|uniref:EAL domain-containing protein n=1 Tax=Psychromonas arctica TaxID=168275 RepID=UPI002FCFC064